MAMIRGRNSIVRFITADSDLKVVKHLQHVRYCHEIYSFELNEEALETLIGGVRQKSYAELAENAALDEKASII
jgi:hypothetical protein